MKLKRDKYLLEDEFKRLLYAARTRPHQNAKRDLAMLAVGGLCGLRAIEIVGIRHGDLDRLDEKVLRVRTAKRRRAQYDDVAAPPNAVAAVKQYARSLPASQRNPWDRLFPLTTRQAGRAFKIYARIAGLNARYSIHSLRHFRGIVAYQSEKDINFARESLRHASLASTQVYVHTVDMLKKGAALDVDADLTMG